MKGGWVAWRRYPKALAAWQRDKTYLMTPDTRAWTQIESHAHRFATKGEALLAIDAACPDRPGQELGVDRGEAS